MQDIYESGHARFLRVVYYPVTKEASYMAYSQMF